MNIAADRLDSFSGRRHRRDDTVSWVKVAVVSSPALEAAIRRINASQPASRSLDESAWKIPRPKMTKLLAATQIVHPKKTIVVDT